MRLWGVSISRLAGSREPGASPPAQYPSAQVTEEADPKQYRPAGFAGLYHWERGVLDALTIIKPETLIRWHRAGLRSNWLSLPKTLSGNRSGLHPGSNSLLCVPKTLSVLIGGGNHLPSAYNDRAALFCPERLGLVI
jgi:hypothetical protein